MPAQSEEHNPGESPAERYERYFVPAIGAPMADDIIRKADPQPGQRILDVACGTGVVTRLAAERVGAAGAVAGLDIEPAMLAVARSVTPPGLSIGWYEASAESMPFPDRAFDAVLCQMGLQFIPDKVAALSEMHRILASGGRAIVTTPGPIPPLFEILEDAIGKHLGADAAKFIGLVFALHDAGEIEDLMHRAGFSDIDVQSEMKSLRLPAPADFLWQYVSSTPVAAAMARITATERDAFTRDVCGRWSDFVRDERLPLDLRMTTAIAAR